MRRQRRGAKVQPRRGERARSPPCARARSALTVRVPHRRDEAHLGRVVRKIVGELELRLEKAALPGARRGGGGARGGMQARGRAAVRGPRQQHKAAPARARVARARGILLTSSCPAGRRAAPPKQRGCRLLAPRRCPQAGAGSLSSLRRARKNARGSFAERTRRRARARARERARSRAKLARGKKLAQLSPMSCRRISSAL